MHETFWTLLRDPAHWWFETLVSGLWELVFGVLLGVVVWPRIRRHIHRDSAKAAVHAAEWEHEHEEALERRVKRLEEKLLAPEEVMA